MNHSIYSVDRMTHLKVVVTALVAAITMVSIVMSSRISSQIDPVGAHWKKT